MLAPGLTPIPFSLRTEDGKHIYTIEGHDHELESVTTNLRVINKPGINDWRVKLGKEESDQSRDEGGDIGRKVHAAGLRLFRGEGFGSYEWSTLGVPSGLDEPYVILDGQAINPETHLRVDTNIKKDERVRNATYALDVLRKGRSLTPIAAECFVWSQAYGYAGTLDAAVLVENELVAAIGSPAGLAELLSEHPEAVAVDLYDWKTSSAIYPEVWLQLAAYAVAFMESYHIPVRRIYPVRLDRGTSVVPRDEDGNPIRTGLYELGQLIRTTEGPVRKEYMEGDDIMDAFENYMHAQELGQFIKRHGGRY